jgi:hypothetical protein
MGNISNFNVNKIDMRLSNKDYWDLYLADGDFSVVPKDTILSGDCLVAHYDFANNAIYGGAPYNDIYGPQYGSITGEGSTTIYSLTTWEDAVNTGYTIPTVGLTGIDNGLITFDKPSGDTTNQALLSALTGTTLVIPSGETRLCLTRVTGMTGDYVYPMELTINTGDTVGNYASLCGGFYQGYYKLDGTDYQVLPNRVPKTWTAEVWLRKPCVETCTGTTGTTLNDNYTGNTGFFLYFGTRAENKFWNIFEGLNTGTTSGCTSGATEWCTIPKETDIFLTGGTGNILPLSPPPIDYFETDNKFLFFSRAKASSGNRCGSCGEVHQDGMLACSWTGGTGGTMTISKIRTEVTDTTNPFLIYSRATSGTTCGGCGTVHEGGQTVCTYTGNTSPVTELDRNADIVDNALGFRITEDGAIGYRKLMVTATCENDITVTGCSVEESYSMSGVVTCDQWQMISIRFVANETLDDCELEWRPARKGKLMFYVNRRLIHVEEDFDEFIARRLVEYSEKQVAVPYNISLGGGTQGLIESMTFDGQDPDDMGSCLQDNFAGTFIGDLSQFRFYICGMNYCDIKNNFEQERERYGLSIDD